MGNRNVPAGEGDVPWEVFLQLVPEEVNIVIEREGGDSRIDRYSTSKKNACKNFTHVEVCCHFDVLVWLCNETTI